VFDVPRGDQQSDKRGEIKKRALSGNKSGDISSDKPSNKHHPILQASTPYPQPATRQPSYAQNA
jgi:hypothetical protein